MAKATRKHLDVELLSSKATSGFCWFLLILLGVSSCVQGQLFSMWLKDLNDDAGGQGQQKGTKLWVFTKAELAEVSGQDIDSDDTDEFYERDGAHIITLGISSSRIINKENIAWELIKLLRKKVIEETEAWTDLNLAEEGIIEKFVGKQTSLAKIVLKNIWGRQKDADVRRIKDILDLIQELYTRLITSSTSTSTEQTVSAGGDAQQQKEPSSTVHGISNPFLTFPGAPFHFPGVAVNTFNTFLGGSGSVKSHNTQQVAQSWFPTIPSNVASAGLGLLPTTTSEILNLLLGDFDQLQQRVPPAATKPASAPAPGVEWNYHKNHEAGPPNWGKENPACAGERQSPVNIMPEECEEFDFDDLVFTNLDAPRGNISIQHNGHSVKMLLQDETEISVNGGGLGTNYVLKQIHFHWGSKNFGGSEHQFKHLRYPAEMHMVFMNTAFNIDEVALRNSDGLAVMGFFINVQPQENSELEEFFKSLDQVRTPKTKQQVTNPINLRNVIAPSLEGAFYRYNGSLTTPGCQQAVIWTLFETPIGVSLRQLTSFLRLQEESGKPLIDNFRPLQPLNGRKIFRKRTAHNLRR